MALDALQLDVEEGLDLAAGGEAKALRLSRGYIERDRENSYWDVTLKSFLLGSVYRPAQPTL